MSDALVHEITALDGNLGHEDAVPISEGDYRQIATANETVLLGLAVEEKFDLLVENYRELEQTLLDMAVQHSVRPEEGWTILESATHTANRRVANFLTTTRLYQDQVSHGLAQQYGADSPEAEAFKRARSHEYDTCPGYCVMEAIRNYAQHRGLPLGGMTLAPARDADTDPPRLGFSVRMMADTRALEADSKFKPAALEELKRAAPPGNEGTVSLLPFVRTYVDSFGRIQDQVRTLMRDHLVGADAVIARFRSKGKEILPEHDGIIAVACGSDGCHQHRQWLLDKPTKRRLQLERKNRHLDTVSRRYATSG